MSHRWKSKFFILNGVRRALVAREAGEETVPATVYREGCAPVSCPQMCLSKLYSPKRSVPNDSRLAAIQLPICEPIEVEALHSRGQQPSIPLARVRLGD